MSGPYPLTDKTIDRALTRTLAGDYALGYMGAGSAAARLSKQVSQFVLGSLESSPLHRWELLARPVQIEGEHRHRRAEGIGLAAMTTLSGTLERPSNLPGILMGEHARLEIQSIAGLGHALGPPLALGRSHADFDRVPPSGPGAQLRHTALTGYRGV